MDQYFRDAQDALKETTAGLERAGRGIIEAGHGIIAATEGIKKAADAMLLAHTEHEDLGVTVARLETELLKLSAEFREYRNGQK